ncbi:large exoprotein [Geofilum rubicundum JCM 15548]|uniref:Large exoprotein n=1 Tax=Geofilum rubicundum JCM 15548 TaxID=1236989 RepID=A0A0E9LUF9_9BACT|nr:large exoprotein [Geofilum rubicundum JCM 15548]
MVNDIDLTEVLSPTGPYYNDGALWEPIGVGAERFESQLEGNGFAIRGLAINRPTENSLGLFFAIGNDGAIQNLKIFTDDVVGIVGQDYMGVLSGWVDMSYMDIYIKNVEVSGKVTGRNYVGGVFGLINMGRNIEHLSAHVNVTGVDFVGGLIGYSGIPLSRCFTTGSVQGENYVGGLVGRNRLDEEFWMEDGRIIDSYSTCSVSGNLGVGGLVGLNEGAVVRSYASGAVSGMTEVGGLFGSGMDTHVSDSFWNTETTGVSVSLGGIGISSGQMRDQATFTGWDFENVWTSLSGENRSFPYFKMVTTDPIPGKIGVPSITTLPNASLVYGQAIGSSVMTGALVEHEGLEVEGSFVLSPTELKPLAGTETVDFVFEPLLPELYLPISGQMDVAVSQAPLTATADNQSRTYGAANPALSISYSGFVNGEDATAITAPEAATLAEATSPVGDYAITLSGGAADNYDLTLENGTLSVSQAPLTATADNQSRTYGAANPALSISYSGFVNGEDATAITAPEAATLAEATSPVGDYAISLSGGAADNYDLTLENGTLSVSQAPLTVTALDQTRTVGDENPVFELDYSGFVNGDDPRALTQLPMASTVADINSIPGEYSIEVGGGDDTNYYFIYQSGTLYVTISVGSPEALEERTVSAYPNPFISEIAFSGFGHSEPKQAALYDLSGRKLRAFMVSDGTSVDLSDLSAGVYLIKVDNQLFKMVKE